MPGPVFNFKWLSLRNWENPEEFPLSPRRKTCHGLSTFLAELVVFDIGKVEISQYFLTRLRTEKSKYYNYNSWHAKSQNITVVSHGMPRLRYPIAN